MRLLSPALVGLAVVLAAAGPLFADVPCVLQSCSNDPWPIGPGGTLGDETVAWDSVPGATSYEVTDCIDPGRTVITGAGTPSLLVSGTVLLSRGASGCLRVRACDCTITEADCACSPYSNAVEVFPFSCTRTTRCYPDPHHPDSTRCDACEEPCYSGADYHLPATVRCPP